MDRQKLVIVGIFFDGYYDIWEDFLELFTLNWPDCPYPLYIVDNTKDLNYEKDYKAQVIHAGENAEYSKKIQKAITEIDAEYYLFLLEDFLIEDKITDDPLENIINYMSKNSVLYYRMQIIDFIDKKKYKIKSPAKIEMTDEYTITCQPSIWEKSFIQKCIGDTNYNAWIFEGIYCYSQYAHSQEFLGKCRVDYRNVMRIRHLALQGKLLPNVYNDFLNRGYIFKTQRKRISNFAYIGYLFRKKIKSIIPLALQKWIKSTLKTKSVVERYKNEILKELFNLGIDSSGF